MKCPVCDEPNCPCYKAGQEDSGDFDADELGIDPEEEEEEESELERERRTRG